MTFGKAKWQAQRSTSSHAKMCPTNTFQNCHIFTAQMFSEQRPPERCCCFFLQLSRESSPPPRFFENRPVEMTARIETALQMVMSFRQGAIDLNTNDLEIMGDLVSRDPIGVRPTLVGVHPIIPDSVSREGFIPYPGEEEHHRL